MIGRAPGSSEAISSYDSETSVLRLASGRGPEGTEIGRGEEDPELDEPSRELERDIDSVILLAIMSLLRDTSHSRLITRFEGSTLYESNSRTRSRATVRSEYRLKT